MNTNLFKSLMLGSAIIVTSLSSCEKKDDVGGDSFTSGADVEARQFITLTAAFPDAEGTAGNGGTRAFAIPFAKASDPNYEVNVFANGYTLRSQRTARVQGSVNGNFLYNIQYTGTDGGIFNKYQVQGGTSFVDTRQEINTSVILGTSPRWVLAANGIGIGVYAASKVEGSKEGAGADFVNVVSTAKVAVLDLDNPEIIRQTEFVIPFSVEQTQAGYQIGRIDVPILNANKTKVFIGCNLTRIDPTKQSTLNTNGVQSWSTTSSTLGTATLVLDYPTLANPKLIFSGVSTANNHSYRTMTQWLSTSGDVYQATATSGSQILKISKATNTYDDSYNFDLKEALGASTNVAIRAWRYIKDGMAVVMYTQTGVNGGFIALVDLNAKTATKLATENQSDTGFSGLTAAQNGGVALTGTFGQFQNIALSGDDVYIPMTPNGTDGNIYIVNYKNKTITKGAKLKNQSGSFYIGAY